MTLRSLALLAALTVAGGFFLWLGTFIMAGHIIADLFLNIYIGLCVLGVAFYFIICALTIVAHDERLRRFFDEH